MVGHSAHSTGPWLHRFAVVTAVAVLVLLGAGGLVTSHNAGMAVPDWPNTFDYNMFFFPVSKWVGGIFYEHTHRLLASGVGLLTSILALWLHGRNARPFMRWLGLALLVLGLGTLAAVPKHWSDGLVLGLTGMAAFGASWVWPRCEPSPRWLRNLGLVAFFAVVLQGLLGGLRVVERCPQIGIFHAALGQMFFVLACALALFTSRWWMVGTKDEGRRTSGAQAGAQGADFAHPTSHVPRPTSLPRLLFMAVTLLILGQLVLGATMRHQHAGLSIPDFPLAYGKLWPATDPASVARYNEQRVEVAGENPLTGTQIILQMVHRGVALLIFCGVAAAAWQARRRLGRRHLLSRLALGWLILIMLQVLLGAATIWSGKAADIATAHVLVGALSLAAGTILSIISFRELALAPRAAHATAGQFLPAAPFGRRASAASLD